VLPSGRSCLGIVHERRPPVWPDGGENICAGGPAKAAARPCTLVKPTSQAVSKVRTNIEIEDTYLQAVMDRYGLRTKTEAVELALGHLAGQPMTREEALAMRGAHATGEVPADTPPPGTV
jgi:Arc/MetJ family transcription regulator